MDTREIIKEYLQQARLMQVSTAKDNQPWTCSVYFAFDDMFNLFWISLPSTRHSQELRENPKVSGTIVLPHEPGTPVRGLQFEGIAKELSAGDSLTHALNTYTKRMGTDEQRKQNIINGTDGHLVYMIKPKLFVLFDTKNFPDNPRQEISL